MSNAENPGFEAAKDPKAVELLIEALDWDEGAGYIYNALGQAYMSAGKFE